jgi:hypothetical protein
VAAISIHALDQSVSRHIVAVAVAGHDHLHDERGGGMNAFLSRIPTVSVDNRVDIITWCLVAIAFAAGVGAGFLPRAQVVEHTTIHSRSIQEQYGHPSTSIAGAKVNPALNGLTCDVYQSRATIICHG